LLEATRPAWARPPSKRASAPAGERWRRRWRVLGAFVFGFLIGRAALFAVGVLLASRF
jgi:hypothetical protein